VIYLFVSPLHNFGSRNSEAFSLECYCCVSHVPFGGEISSILVYCTYLGTNYAGLQYTPIAFLLRRITTSYARKERM